MASRFVYDSQHRNYLQYHIRIFTLRYACNSSAATKWSMVFQIEGGGVHCSEADLKDNSGGAPFVTSFKTNGIRSNFQTM